MKKRGQLNLSFGMIFSIILIILFIIFAFYAIQKFLGLQKDVSIGTFKDDLQTDVDRAWKGSSSSEEVEYRLPKEIEDICFANFNSNAKPVRRVEMFNELKRVFYEYENLVFYPVGSATGVDALVIKHLDIEKITEDENPFCISNEDGKVNMTITKNFGEDQVNILR